MLVIVRFNVEVCGVLGGDGICKEGVRGGRGVKVRGIF